MFSQRYIRLLFGIANLLRSLSEITVSFVGNFAVDYFDGFGHLVQGSPQGYAVEGDVGCFFKG
jgi:hypothetical protein